MGIGIIASMKKHILITNDDSYESAGIKALIEALRPLAKLTIVAPSSEKSACGHSLTLTRPLRFVQVDDDFYKLDDGTPSDCVYLALNSMFDESNRPDLIVSGINHGANMGEDITYSGTASAAMEGVLQGVPSISISQVLGGAEHSGELDFEPAKRAINHLVQKVLNGGFPLMERNFLNINIPSSSMNPNGKFKITHAGHRLYGNDAHLHRNPRGEEYYWLGLHPLQFKKREGVDGMSDYDAVLAGFISISPIMLDMTAYQQMDRLHTWMS